jgi:hypothetical protein
MYAVPKSDAVTAKVRSGCHLTLLLQRSGIVGDFNSFDVEAHDFVVAPSNPSCNIFSTFSESLKQKIFKTVSLLSAEISTVRASLRCMRLLIQLPSRLFQSVAEQRFCCSGGL